jgi:hypothetical protein
MATRGWKALTNIMIIEINVEQGTPEWLDVRKGRATASEFDKIITPTGKVSKSGLAYMRKLARECVCEDPHEKSLDFVKAIKWGNEHEPAARDWFHNNIHPVEEVGFVHHGDLTPVGCSPDGLLPIDLVHDLTDRYHGGLEIKCPQVDTHVGYLMEGKLPAKYKLQVHGSMAVTGLDYWYFMSYFPGLNPFVLKVERDDFTELVSTALHEFADDYLKERDRVIAAILPAKKTAAPEPESVI